MALKITSKKDIHISGQTNIKRIFIWNLTQSVKIDSGFEFNSSLIQIFR